MYGDMLSIPKDCVKFPSFPNYGARTPEAPKTPGTRALKTSGPQDPKTYFAGNGAGLPIRVLANPCTVIACCQITFRDEIISRNVGFM